MKKMLLIITMLIMLVGCASQNCKPKWHISLETKDGGQWVEAKIYSSTPVVFAGGYEIRLSNRHMVLAEQIVLSEYGATEFRYCVGVKKGRKFHVLARFDNYADAVAWYVSNRGSYAFDLN